ncbi:hypothetical protein [Pedobacter mendelii]|nr:hypothetical protein [Pedobacter mendelii]
MMRKIPDGDPITLTGMISKIGMTTFQYGTHTITTNGKLYALKSSSLVLDTYIDKQAIVKGVKVSGYPLEGGPELVEVITVVMN